MRLVLAGHGTEGDTRPLLALATAAQRRGHEVHVLGDVAGAGAAAAAGVPFTALDGDLVALLHGSGPVGEALRSGSTVGSAAALRFLYREHGRAWRGQVEQAAAGADVLVGSSLVAHAAAVAARDVGVPFAAAAFQPLRPSPEYLAVGPAGLPSPLTTALGVASMHTGWRLVAPWLRRPGERRVSAPRWADMPLLNAFSPVLVPPSPAWPGHDVTTGPWLPGRTADPGVTKQVAAFVAEGPPPVYLGFGSMAAADARRLLAVAAQGLSGSRVLVATGWAGEGAVAAGEPPLPLGRRGRDVLVVDRVDHAWLLPRCRVAVHHAGAGTTHAAARAGVPQVPVPFVADQPFWARQSRKLGIATAALDRRRTAASDLAAAVAEAETLRGAAAAVARRMEGEAGTALALDALERRALTGEVEGSGHGPARP